jgi:hypothetical protein
MLLPASAVTFFIQQLSKPRPVEVHVTLRHPPKPPSKDTPALLKSVQASMHPSKVLRNCHRQIGIQYLPRHPPHGRPLHLHLILLQSCRAEPRIPQLARQLADHVQDPRGRNDCPRHRLIDSVPSRLRGRKRELAGGRLECRQEQGRAEIYGEQRKMVEEGAGRGCSMKRWASLTAHRDGRKESLMRRLTF